MSLRFLAAPALVAAAFAPAISQAQQSQITIQTQATVTVPPDRGTVPVIVSARAKTEREARALLERNDKETRTALAAMGFKPGQITVLATSEPEIHAEVDLETCAALDATGEATDLRAASAAEPIAESTSDAENAAHDASIAAAAAADSMECKEKAFIGARSLLVQIETSAQEQALTDADRAGDMRFGKATYVQSDPAGAKQKARDAAMAQARQDADATAASMGYRITGISRVSTADAPITMPGIIRFITEVDGPGRKRTPEWFTASTSQTVTIDFIAVPK